MILFENLELSCSFSSPCALTIGSFDGVHLGHQKILREMRKRVGNQGSVAVLTFSNHPSHVLPGRDPVPLIFSKELKIKALEEQGVDICYCIPFTENLSQQPYDVFLQEVRNNCPFDFLILGEGACLGYKRGGTPEKVALLGEKLGFSCIYIPKREVDEQAISSRAVRECILKGDLQKAHELLGRPFTIEGEVHSQRVFLSAPFCLPPDGEYPVKTNHHQSILSIQGKKLTLKPPVKDGKIFIDFI